MPRQLQVEDFIIRLPRRSLQFGLDREVAWQIRREDEVPGFRLDLTSIENLRLAKLESAISQ
jgi:hypothetical protein